MTGATHYLPVMDFSPGSPQARAMVHVEALSSGESLDPALRVNIHFHPDRLRDGRTVVAALARDGVYRSQFETGISNGSLSAYPGGARWAWESRMFGGAYDGASPADRPKYGALNYRRRRLGGAIRFGSAHLRMAAAVSARSTYCYPDSFSEPAGTTRRR